MPLRYTLPKWPTLNLERECTGTVCGVDEAGCAPLAGPVVAAAVVLPRGAKPRQLRGLTDSKLLDAGKREHYFDLIQRIGQVAVGMATVEEIDELNIFHADMLAMQRAVAGLASCPDFALVDGRAAPALPCGVKPVVKGDRRSLSIAAASVVAKVVRDRLMRELAARFPAYGWETNVGYGTDAHYLGLLRAGPTEHHRQSFAPLNTIFGPGGPVLGRFRFQPLREPPDFSGLALLELRQDLYAVFDGNGHHLGVLKRLRGHWTFSAVAYGEDGEPVRGAGPCAPFQGARLPAPERAELLRLFARQSA